MHRRESGLRQYRSARHPGQKHSDSNAISHCGKVIPSLVLLPGSADVNWFVGSWGSWVRGFVGFEGFVGFVRFVGSGVRGFVDAGRVHRIERMIMALLLLFVLALPAPAAAQANDEYFVYVGTYTRTSSKGIYAFRFRPATGEMAPMGLVAETPHSSFIAAHPSGQFLYATNEHEGANPPGVDNTISAFAIDASTGALTFLNKVSSRGEGPNHISVDATGRSVLVANFRNGTVAALPIQPNGSLGDATSVIRHTGSSIHPVRQTGPHAHFISPSPDNRYVLAVDLGTDQIVVYRFDPAKGSLTPNDPHVAKAQTGSQPRHLAFHPTAKFAYVNGEASSTISAFSYDAARGTLQEIQTVSTLPAEFSGTNTTAEVLVDRTGRFVYVSNRGHDSIAAFGIDQATGRVTPIDHTPTNGRTPRHFTFDPSGRFLMAVNQNSNTAALYRVDAASGRLTHVSMSDVPEPACVILVPARR